MTARSGSFSGEEREGVYRAIAERRDIRNYLPDSVDEQLLWRILRAAHCAPSVGMMQPWSFVVIQDLAPRKRLYRHFAEINAQAAKQYTGERSRRYQALKLQGLLDAPLNVLVTCSPSRTQRPVLGRFTMRHMDEYSTCLAVQNMWLAARSEGLGMGWMSLMDPQFVADLFHLPEDVLPVAYLTLGYPVEFPDAPMLERTGWAEKLPLSDLVFDGQFGRRLLTPDSDQAAKQTGTTSAVKPTALARTMSEEGAATAAQGRLDELTKPPGSLGRLEQIAVQLCRLQRSVYPSANRPTLLLFAADHGVAEENVSAYQPSATAQMMYQFAAGAGAVNALCRQHQVALELVDVGVDHDFGSATGISQHKVRRATGNIRTEAAMTGAQMLAALEVGRSGIGRLQGVDVVALGEMGIGNTTASAAVLSALTGWSAAQTVGFGTGAAGARLHHKQDVVAEAVARAGSVDASGALQQLGGLEIAAMVGAIEAACDRRLLVVLDGFIASVAALVASRRKPEVLEVLLAGHRGAEQAHHKVLELLGLAPLLELELRLGEGTGAVLALSLVQSATRLAREMRTFEETNQRNPAAAFGRPEGTKKGSVA